MALRKDLELLEQEYLRRNEQIDAQQQSVLKRLEDLNIDFSAAGAANKNDRPSAPTESQVQGESQRPPSRPTSASATSQRDQPRLSARRNTPPQKAALQVKRSLELEDHAETTGLGPEAAVRYYKARVAVMQDELEQASLTQAQMAADLREKREEVLQKDDSYSKLVKSLSATQKETDKLKAQLSEEQGKTSNLQKELTELKKEFENYKKSTKQSLQDSRTQEVRLNRALEELEKYRNAAKENRSVKQEEGKQYREERDKLLAENRRLDKQKVELLNAFKKQMKLIDILKRQKIHMEAAKQLSFTEEEFSRILEYQ